MTISLFNCICFKQNIYYDHYKNKVDVYDQLFIIGLAIAKFEIQMAHFPKTNLEISILVAAVILHKLCSIAVWFLR